MPLLSRGRKTTKYQDVKQVRWKIIREFWMEYPNNFFTFARCKDKDSIRIFVFVRDASSEREDT